MRCVRYAVVLTAIPLAASSRSAAQVATDPEVLSRPAVVSTDWVAKRVNRPGVAILDVRGNVELYGAGHLPRAVLLNIESLRATIDGVPAKLLPAEDLARRFGAMGVSNTTQVIIYGDQDNVAATYVALALDRLGHRAYAIMEGGYPKWVAEGRETIRALPLVKPRDYSPAEATYEFTADLSAVRDAVRDREATYIDTRGPAQFAEGHIPRAINHPTAADVAAGNAPLWSPIDKLKASYEAHGLAPDSPVIVGCNTGRSASHAYFTLRHVLGYKNVRWYDGSMTEWRGHPYLPVEKAGEKPQPQTPEQ